MKLYVLLISHRHGDDVSLYLSDAAAKAALADYCREWWQKELGDETPIPADDEEAVLQYFDAADDESAEIMEREVIAEDEPALAKLRGEG